MGLFDVTRSYYLFTALHIVCLALALAVCGLYGRDVNSSNRLDRYAGSKWVYAVVVGALSAITCVIYFVPPVLRRGAVVATVWNAILFILWIAVFGVFGAMYIHEDARGNQDVRRMKSAVWVDLTNALLWLASTLGVFGYWWTHRDGLSQFTGRARV